MQGSWEVVHNWGDNKSSGVDETAVVAALSFWDYSLVSDVQGSDTYKATGRCFSVAAGRISYTFSFKGACSNGAILSDSLAQWRKSSVGLAFGVE